MSQPYSNVAQVIQCVMQNGAHQATKYVSPKQVVKVTRRLSGGKVPPRNDANLDFVVTLGRPNYADRKYIKQCIKAGEPFPVKKFRLQFVGKRKPAKPVKAKAGRPSAKLVRKIAAVVLGQTRARGNG